MKQREGLKPIGILCVYMCYENKRGKRGKPHSINQAKPNPVSKRKTTGQALRIEPQLNRDTHLHSHHFDGPNYVLRHIPTHSNI